MKLSLIKQNQEVLTITSQDPERFIKGLGNNIRLYKHPFSELYFYFSANADKRNGRASRMADQPLSGDVYVSLERLKLQNLNVSSQTDFKGENRRFSIEGDQIPSKNQQDVNFNLKSGFKWKSWKL